LGANLCARKKRRWGPPVPCEGVGWVAAPIFLGSES
jgi:hypothetical protein